VIWDETAPIYLLGPTNLFSEIRRGDLLEAVGVTDPGEFAPIVRVARARKIGSAPPPAAKPVTFEELLSGRLDAHWVEVSGVVRSVDAAVPKGFGGWRMEVAVGSGKLSVLSNGPRSPEVTPDAQVRVQAACFYQFTQRRQVLRPMLLVPAGVSVQVVKPALTEAESPPVRPAGSLLEFSPESASGHRVHVRGIVTHQEPGAFVWIRDNSGALRIQTRQPEMLHPGDEVDVLGFPKYGSYVPALEDAAFQKLSPGKPPVPVELITAEAAFDHQADLVAMVATLTEIERIPDGWLLAVQKNGTPFKALLKSSADLPETSAWRPGSIVGLVGICSVIGDEAEPVVSGVWHPQTFQFLLRSGADVNVVKPAPWWDSLAYHFPSAGGNRRLPGDYGNRHVAGEDADFGNRLTGGPWPKPSSPRSYQSEIVSPVRFTIPWRRGWWPLPSICGWRKRTSTAVPNRSRIILMLPNNSSTTAWRRPAIRSGTCALRCWRQRIWPPP